MIEILASDPTVLNIFALFMDVPVHAYYCTVGYAVLEWSVLMEGLTNS